MSGETTLTSAKIPCRNFLNNRQTARSHARLVGRSFGTNQHMQLWLVCFFSSVFLACQAPPSLSMRNVWNSYLENSLGAWTARTGATGKAQSTFTFTMEIGIIMWYSSSSRRSHLRLWYVLCVRCQLGFSHMVPLPHGPVSSTCPTTFVFPSSSHSHMRCQKGRGARICLARRCWRVPHGNQPEKVEGRAEVSTRLDLAKIWCEL